MQKPTVYTPVPCLAGLTAPSSPGPTELGALSQATHPVTRAGAGTSNRIRRTVKAKNKFTASSLKISFFGHLPVNAAVLVGFFMFFQKASASLGEILS